MNPIKVTLVLTNVFVLWHFVPVQYGEEQNQENPVKHLSNETHFQKVTSLLDRLIINTLLLIHLCITEG